VNDRDLLGIRVIPVVDEKGTLVLVVILAFVTSRAKGHSLDQRTASKQIKDFPDGLARVKKVARHGLAISGVVIPLLCVRVIIEVEERDVAQSEVSQVGENIIRQLEALDPPVLGVRHGLDSGSDVALIGG
jgi:hypothetical protein